jgi:hypothetical protein
MGLIVKRKYVFTQASAPVIGCFTGYVAVRMLFHFLSDWYQPDKVFHVLFFGVTIIMSCLIGIFLWGKVLLFLGVLTKEEAKGYPFSKPWNKGTEE